MNRTLQDRIVNELRVVAKATTVEAANQYLLECYLPTHNEEFAKPPADRTSAFVRLGDVDVERGVLRRGRSQGSARTTWSVWTA